MSCLPDGVLQALINRELSESERKDAERHLAECRRCHARFEQLERTSRQVVSRLSELDPSEQASEDTPAALARLRARLDSDAEQGILRENVLRGFFARHPAPAWGAAAIIALVVILISLAPARSAAQRVLAMLRIQKVTVVPVDFATAPNRDTMQRVRQLISSRVTVTLSPGKPQIEPDAASASKVAGFAVRGLTGVPGTPHIAVVGEQAYVMTLDRARLEEILSDLGRSDLRIPPQVDGQTIAVHIPKAAFIRYGDCEFHKTGAEAPGTSQGAAGCIAVAEVPSPIVSVPPGLDINELAEIALEAAGMSEAQAAAFCQTVDWKSTLVIPIPENASSYQQVEVNGVEGTLIMGRPHEGRPGEFALVWVKNGLIYSIHGTGGPDRALALAGSMS